MTYEVRGIYAFCLRNEVGNSQNLCLSRNYALLELCLMRASTVLPWDVLALRRTCKALDTATHDRWPWIAIAQRTSREFDVPLSESECTSMSVKDLEQFITALARMAILMQGGIPLKWADFVKLMVSIGFDCEMHANGTGARFIPQERRDKPITFPRPRPDPIHPVLLREYARKLMRYYTIPPAAPVDGPLLSLDSLVEPEA